jgi:hypothetical protein
LILHSSFSIFQFLDALSSKTVLTCFELDYLGNTASMAASFKGSLQPKLDHALNEFFAQQIGRETQDVGIIMPPAHFGGNAVMARRSTDAGNLVGGDAHADPGAANEDASFGSARSHVLGYLESEVGIIDAGVSFGTHIEDFVLQIAQEPYNSMLGIETPMVAANRYFHGYVTTCREILQNT